MKIEWDIHKDGDDICYFYDYKRQQIMIVKHYQRWLTLYYNLPDTKVMSLEYLPQTEAELELILAYK